MSDADKINTDKINALLDCIEGLWWQYATPCLDGKGRFTCISAVEWAEDILLEYGRIKKYRKNGRMEWYIPKK